MKLQAAVSHSRRYAAVYGALLVSVAATFVACSNDAPTATKAPSAPASFDRRPTLQPRIVFASNRTGNYEVYIMNADGSHQTELTFGRGNETAPVLSDDQTKIAFVSTRSNINGDIYVMNADGTGQTRITNTNAFNHSPSWSPDGTKIVFSSTRDAADPTKAGPYSNWELYSMNANGSNVTRLTNDAVGEWFPAWSADGKHIAFTSDKDHPSANGGVSLGRELYVMNADGTNVKRVTNQDGQLIGPSWSPDSKRIAYHVYAPASAPGVYVLDAKTGVSTRLTFGGGYDDAWVSFSPDGNKLAYTHYVTNIGHIWTMNDDGTGKTQITHASGNDLGPKWSR